MGGGGIERGKEVMGEKREYNHVSFRNYMSKDSSFLKEREIHDFHMNFSLFSFVSCESCQ